MKTFATSQDRLSAPARRAVPMPWHRDTWGILKSRTSKLILVLREPPLCCYATSALERFYVNQNKNLRAHGVTMSPPRCWINHSLRSRAFSECSPKNKDRSDSTAQQGHRCERIGKSGDPFCGRECACIFASTMDPYCISERSFDFYKRLLLLGTMSL